MKLSLALPLLSTSLELNFFLSPPLFSTSGADPFLAPPFLVLLELIEIFSCSFLAPPLLLLLEQIVIFSCSFLATALLVLSGAILFFLAAFMPF